MKLLVTGGTVFVSKYIVEYFVKKGNEVFVLNRNTRPQVEGAQLIQADRKNIGGVLRKMHFDAILDVNSYTAEDVKTLLESGVSFDDYIMISSSAVYPEYAPMPFSEDEALARNKFWGEYGTNKIAAEQALLQQVPQAYILRPPYLYGIYNNVYREAFVFDCAMADRKFYLPGDGSMKMQFFHVKDLCRFIECLFEKKPKQNIFNVGNYEMVSIREWVTLCYEAAGKKAEFVSVAKEIPQRSYFSFADYEYELNVEQQKLLLTKLLPLQEGLTEACEWYRTHRDEVNRKPYFEYIDGELQANR